MDVLDYARSYLKDFKVVNGNVQAKYCPFCHGGKHGDKYTFGISIDKQAYSCRRGSCGASGHLTELLRKEGIETEVTKKNYKKTKIKKEYKVPDTVGVTNLSEKALEYAKLRKISEDTLLHFNVEQKDKNYVFNFYSELGNLTFVKYRPIGKIKKGKQQKALRQKDTMPILFNMNNIDTESDLVICEGEFDALSIFEAGYKNVTSVPSGCSDFTWLDTCWEWLKNFKGNFILYGDNDSAGRKMVKELSIKLGEYRVKTVEHKRKDANEDLFFEGKETVLENIENAKFVTKAGILEVANIEEEENKESIPTGFRSIDRLLEDVQLGDLTIWTGKNASGKSTILGQVILEAIENDYGVFCYSGELTGARFKGWINMQAAGAENIEAYRNKYNDIKFRCTKKASDLISKWYQNKLFLYDNQVKAQNIEATKIIDICKFAAKRYNCKMFVIDNLMTADFDVKNSNDYYRAQSEFVGELVNFAKTFNVTVHLVAHPRKTQGLVDKDAVGGTGDITNRADNVISIERFNDDEEQKTMIGEKNFVPGCTGMLNLLKNRNTGEVGFTLLQFDKQTRRMTTVNKDGIPMEQRKYSWEKLKENKAKKEVENLPF